MSAELLSNDLRGFGFCSLRAVRVSRFPNQETCWQVKKRKKRINEKHSGQFSRKQLPAGL